MISREEFDRVTRDNYIAKHGGRPLPAYRVYRVCSGETQRFIRDTDEALWFANSHVEGGAEVSVHVGYIETWEPLVNVEASS